MTTANDLCTEKLDLSTDHARFKSPSDLSPTLAGHANAEPYHYEFARNYYLDPQRRGTLIGVDMQRTSSQ